MAQEQQMKKIAEGREAEIFEWEDGTILRLMRGADGQRANELQAVALESARASGVRVPAVLEVTTVMARPGLIMERIEGTDYLTILGKQPWLVFSVGGLSGVVHAKLNEARASADLPALRSVLQARIASCGRLPEEIKRSALGAIESLRDGDRLCHGDFHPGNILRTGEGPVVIDWTNATRGDPDADVARTNLMLRIGEPPPGSPIVVRLLARVGGRILLWRYLQSYGRHRTLGMTALSRWEVPIAAARVADGIESEIPVLLSFLERRRSVV